MKYVDEYRDAPALTELLAAVRRRATRRWTIMEICGGQTHGLLKWGIDEALADVVELLHGPGCPVCVTSAEAIDQAVALSLRPEVILTTFGDMLRVPGSKQSLADARAIGGTVRAVYSPLDALATAIAHPQREIVFLAVGFETTAPTTALAVRQAAQCNVTNFSFLTAHVRVEPAMEAILREPQNQVQAFLAAGHVCTVSGYQSYEELCRRHRVPIVVTGFEPLDLATGIAACIRQLEERRFEVENRYGRCVRPEGNVVAGQFVDAVYEPCDQVWRGLGTMPQGGLRLRDEWQTFDARHRFALGTSVTTDDDRCRSGAVLSGRIRPPQCPAFGKECTPEHPLGAPMVSAEGACAAYYRYHTPHPLTMIDACRETDR